MPPPYFRQMGRQQFTRTSATALWQFSPLAYIGDADRLPSNG